MTQENALKLFKCLSDTSRLRIVQSLTRGEMYTELLAERLNLTPSTVSFHMKKLEEAGLAISRKEQYYTVYSLNREVLEKTIMKLRFQNRNRLTNSKSGRKNTAEKSSKLSLNTAGYALSRYSAKRS